MGLFGRRNDKILLKSALKAAGGLTQTEFGALVCEATRRSTGIVMTDEQIGVGLSMLDEASGRKKTIPNTRVLAALLPTGRDRALAAAFPIFLYSRLARSLPELGGVHVLTIDEQHARHDTDLYRTISNELDWNQIGLVYEDQASGERQAAYAATTTIGADDQFRLDRTTGMLAVIRLPTSPSRYASRYPWRTYLPDTEDIIGARSVEGIGTVRLPTSVPGIEIGMPKEEVLSCLGEPSVKTSAKEVHGRAEHVEFLGGVPEYDLWYYRDVPTPGKEILVRLVNDKVATVDVR
ncbi:hypothetical protein [Streptomyces radicis]|uniref:Uncharacterized protein n=1 Tax=Streptomyces radicis TaxID=1750517 RepID=A0A3A9VW81_9ACTN|nr:hypothetical protein [Streptomyces radicis]RKN04782.1 hypothetical protein D7319_27580 [Streptomyces radicis]RKN15988.1 hypothetical protein D7318_26625 [Streptomyces radicis]